jgi:15-cis-phytoene synthase
LPRSDVLLEESRAAIRVGSRSFARASLLFDPRTRDSAHLLYAWCRHCDDEIDGQHLGHDAASPRDHTERLERLRRLTRAALAGEETGDPHFAALQRVARYHGIPERHPLELIDGFAMDVAGRRYGTLEDTLEYCYHVAGVVGVMMGYVMGAREPAALRRAADLGLALQMTNIARDVVPDAEQGRVYLPGAWLDEAGVPRTGLADPSRRAPLARLARRLLAEAEPYYASADRGLGYLTFRSAWAVAAARRVYAEIGHLVESRGERAWDARTVVPKRRQTALVMRAALDALGRRRPPEGDDGEPELWTTRLALERGSAPRGAVGERG